MGVTNAANSEMGNERVTKIELKKYLQNDDDDRQILLPSTKWLKYRNITTARPIVCIFNPQY